MCGIFLYISEKEVHRNKILRIKNLMQNRGPDYQSYKKIKFQKKNLHFFHSRLSIQDLHNRSNQPYIFKDYVLIFNGEIYNFKELKQKLNIKFRTFSDTEVILHYYHLYKDKCFKYFEGMWSIVIFDLKQKKIVISRDRFGEKPVLLYKKNNEIIISSQVSFINEILSTKQSFNYKKINTFLQYGYKSIFKDNKTFFKNISHLENGSILTINKNFEISKKKYWKLKNNKDIEKLSLEDHIQNTRELLIKSIELRMISDVPVALNLSGGIDSGAICSIASKILGKKLETFSLIDSDKRYDESSLINATANDCGVKTNFINIKKNVNFLEILRKSTNYNNYPVFTITNLIQNTLCSFIKSKGFKVSLSGSGADEIYGGYYDHYLMVLNELKKNNIYKYRKFKKIWTKNIRPFLRNNILKKHDLFFKNSNYRGYIFDNFNNNTYYCLKKLKYIFKEKHYFDNLLKQRMANELFHENVPVFMHSEDLNSMQYSIENRSPFLDTNLIDYLFNVKNDHLLNQSQNKYILRSSLRGILNSRVLNTKIKSGFNASVSSLFNFKDKKMLNFLDQKSEIYDFVNKSRIENLIKNKKLLKLNGYSKFLFTFLSLKTFMDRFN